MEQRTLKNVKNCLNTKNYSSLETSDDQSYNLYLYEVHFFNTSVNLPSVAAKTIFFMHWCLICAVLLL
jgi:hypothetical protein